MGTTQSSAAPKAMTAEAAEIASVVHPMPEIPDAFSAAETEHAVAWHQPQPCAVEQVFVGDGAMTPEEAEALVAMSEAIGYTDAPVTTAMGPRMLPDVRTNKRVMVEASPEFLEILANRIEAIIPRVVWARQQRWRLLTGTAMLNERLRFYRYADPSEKFAPHFDGAFPRSRTERSHFTLLVYLSDGFEGGETTLFPEGRTTFDGPVEVEPVAVVPRVGRALLFRHSGGRKFSPFHEGTPLKSEGGIKYVLRSDVMFEAYPCPCEDGEGCSCELYGQEPPPDL